MCAEALIAGLASRWSGLWLCTRGNAAVEFVFVFPLLIILVLGIYTVGSVLHSASSVRYALEETARALQLNPDLTEDELQEIIDGKLTNYGNQAVTLSMAVAEDGFGSEVAHLTASYPFTIAVPYIPTYEGAYQQNVEVFLVLAE